MENLANSSIAFSIVSPDEPLELETQILWHARAGQITSAIKLSSKCIKLNNYLLILYIFFFRF